MISGISTVHNFEFGDEFEVAIGKALRTFLPEKFGVCRGYAVDVEGNKAGDDLLIYDRDRFPLLRLLEDVNFDVKHEIPIEAVYAYIECKHTIFLKGEGPQSLNKAISQVENVKKLKRYPVPLSQLQPYLEIKLPVKPAVNWPNIRNPLYSAIIARSVRMDESKKKVKARKIEADWDKDIRSGCQLDLIIFGKDVVVLPTVGVDQDYGTTIIDSPFFIPSVSTPTASVVSDSAFGIGFTMMSWALDGISLGKMQFKPLLNDAFSKADTGPE